MTRASAIGAIFALASLTAFALAPLTAPFAAAQEPTPAQNKQAEELKAAWAAAANTATRGPSEIKLLDEASLALADDQVFVPAAEANQIMQALGNGARPSRFGLILGRKSDSHWLIDVNWVHEGYVRDGDAKEWQADALLDSLRAGTESGNAERIARGLPGLEVVGWIEPPAYDASAHRLVWSLSLRGQGAPANEPQTINYNTYALGREGFFSLDLITDTTSIDADKSVVRQMLQTLTYAPGKRYEDFNQSTDKVAVYGLAALIGAVAVKKLGLIALAGVFLLKIWKIGLIAILAAGAFLRRLVKSRGKPDAGA